MATKKRKETMEYRVYDIPQGRIVLTLQGDSWKRVYGHEQRILHFHNLTEVGICYYGEGELTAGPEIIRYHDGCITCFPANFPHHTYSYGSEPNYWEFLFFDLRTIVQQIYPDAPVYANRIVQFLSSRPVICRQGEWPAAEPLIRAILKESADRDPFYVQALENYMRLLVLEIIRHQADLPEYEETPVTNRNAVQITAAINYIGEHLDQPIRVQDLAAQCNLSETHFRRLFDECTEMSPMEYVNLCRIQRACELMRQGNDSMEQIADQCGFGNISTFNRNFHKFLGVSPYQWKIDPENTEGSLNKYRILPRRGW